MPYAYNPFTNNLDFFVPGSTSVATANIRANVSPTESPDGSRVTFTVPETYIAGTLTVFLNGIAEGYATETTTTTFTFDEAPLTGDIIKLNYAVTA